MKKEDKGFSLIELIICLIIFAILSQIGFVAFRRYSRRVSAFAAETALLNVMKECQSNKDLETNQSFTRIEPKSYFYASKENNCSGNTSEGLVYLNPYNDNELPTYFYDHKKGEVSCFYNGFINNLFNKCVSKYLKNNNMLNWGSTGTASSWAGPITLLDDGNIKHEGFYGYRYNRTGRFQHCGLLKNHRWFKDNGRNKPGWVPHFHCDLTKYLYKSQVEAIKEGGFVRVFAGGQDDYLAQRADGSVVVFGLCCNNWQHKGDPNQTQKGIKKLLSSNVVDVYFAGHSIGALLDTGEIISVGSENEFSEHNKVLAMSKSERCDYLKNREGMNTGGLPEDYCKN